MFFKVHFTNKLVFSLMILIKSHLNIRPFFFLTAYFSFSFIFSSISSCFLSYSYFFSSYSSLSFLARSLFFLISSNLSLFFFFSSSLASLYSYCYWGFNFSSSSSSFLDIFLISLNYSSSTTYSFVSFFAGYLSSTTAVVAYTVVLVTAGVAVAVPGVFLVYYAYFLFSAII